MSAARAVADAAALSLPAVLGATSTEGLLDAMVRLTHAIHEQQQRTDLRDQRDLIKAEVLRRCER